jgi:prepilin-type N-terminal cleavage/methylation domain-containing protein
MPAETHTHMRSTPQRVAGRGEHGMTMVEVMVAMVILLVGVLGSITLLDVGNHATTDNTTRDAAVALAREQLETAREVTFTALPDVTNVAAKVTSVLPGVLPATLFATTFAQFIPGVGTFIVPARKFVTQRLGVQFDSTLWTCVLDDPSDGIGPAPGNACTPVSVASGGGGSSGSGAGSPTLPLNILGIGITGGGQVIEAVCALLGTRGSVIDSLLGTGGLLAPLVSTGADTTYCAGKGNVAFDREPADAVAITTVVNFTYPGSTRTGSVTQRVVVPGPRVTS